MIYIATIPTNDGQRIAKRLYNHWKHKFNVQQTEQTFMIDLPSAQLTMTPQADELILQLNTTEQEASRFQSVVIEHLNRMAQQEFETTWYTP